MTQPVQTLHTVVEEPREQITTNAIPSADHAHSDVPTTAESSTICPGDVTSQSVENSVMMPPAYGKFRPHAKVTITDENCLGEHHEDEETLATYRGKKTPLEDHYDDCGDDLSMISTVDHVTLYENESDCSSTYSYEDLFTSDFYQWHMQGTVPSEDIDEISLFESSIQNFSSMTHALAVLSTTQGDDIAEVFGGAAGVTRVSIRRKLQSGPNFDLTVGCDLTKSSEQAALIAYVTRCKPKVLIMGPPCTAFGGWSRYNRKHAYKTWHERYVVGIKLAILTCKLCELQLSACRHFIVENPLTSTLWDLMCFRKLRRHQQVCGLRIDQCMLGLKGPDGQRSMKPTLLLASDARLLAPLQTARCNGKHKHARLEGSYQGVSRTSFAQTWPRLLCERLVQGIINVLRAQPNFPVSAVPAICPGCKQHARRDDPRHTRKPPCRFPADTAITWECPACKSHKPSTDQRHSRDATCQWSIASKRQWSGRDARTTHPGDIVEQEPLPPAVVPPKLNGMSWWPVTDDALRDRLIEASKREGWTVISIASSSTNPQQAAVYVDFNCRALRSCEPRHSAAAYPLRSTYGLFTDLEPMWWQIENDFLFESEPLQCRTTIGFPIDIVIMVFAPQPKEKIPLNRSSTEVSAADSTAPSTASGQQQTQQPQPVVGRGASWQQRPPPPAARPLAPVEEGVPDELPPLVEPGEQQQQAENQQWSTFDMGHCLRDLRSDQKPRQIAAIRRLHMRWWHCGAQRMERLLAAAGISPAVRQLIQPIVDSCKVCRLWKRPSARPETTSRLSNNFNENVQMDIMYWQDSMILLLIDEAIRFEAGSLIENRLPSTLTSTITNTWFRIFGPPTILCCDQEGGMASEATAIWAERWQVALKLRPRDAHPPIIERHHQVLRDLLHKIETQAKTEGLVIPQADILAEALYAKNCLITVGDFTPYTGLLGRQPRILSDFETPAVSADQDDEGGDVGSSRNSVRLREIAVESMVQALAQHRLKRANSTKTRRAGELDNLVTGDLVEIYRTPATKDLTGWRGPATVVGIDNITNGWIDVRWQGRVMSARIPEVRRVTALIAFLSSIDMPISILRRHILALSANATYVTCGWVIAIKGWVLTAHAKEHNDVFNAILLVARSTLGLIRCCGARMGRGHAVLPGLSGMEWGILMWWPVSKPDLYRMMSHNMAQSINLKPVIDGTETGDVGWIQFMSTDRNGARKLRQLSPENTLLAPDPDDNMPMPPNDPHDNESIATRREDPMDFNYDPQPLSTQQNIDIDDDDMVFPPPPFPPPSYPPSPSGPTPIASMQSMRSDATQRVPMDSIQHPSTTREPLHSDNSMANADAKRPLSTTTSNPAPHKLTRFVTDHEKRPLSTTTSNPSPHKQTRFAPDDSGQTGASSSSASHGISATPVNPASFSPAEPTLPMQDDETSNASAETIPYDELYAYWNDGGINVALTRHYPQKNAEEGSYAPDPNPEVIINTGLDVLTEKEIQDNKALVLKAAELEAKSFGDLETFKLITRQEGTNIMSSKWIFRWKRNPDVPGERVVKGRLTVRGFQDKDADILEVYAATASRMSQRYIISMAVILGFEVWAIDISAAFLRGMTFKELAELTGTPIRRVCFDVPMKFIEAFRKLPGMQHYDPKIHTLLMIRPIYGLKDAPRAWRTKLHRTLLRLGARNLHCDSSVYVVYQGSQLIVIFSCHVDDIKMAGKPEHMRQWIELLEKEFGKLKCEKKNFTHCGIRHTTLDDGTITLDQDEYAKSLQLASTEGLVESEDKLLPEDKLASFRTLLGGLSWLGQTRGDVLVYIQALQRISTKAKNTHLFRLNRIVKWIRRTPFKLHFRPMSGPLKVLVISDSAYRREDVTGHALRGAVICIAQDLPNSPGGICHCLEMYSRKQRRVVRSTFSAEANALIDAVEVGKMVVYMLTDTFSSIPLSASQLMKMDERGELTAHMHAVVDCKSVYDALVRREILPPTEQSLIMLLLALRETMTSGCMRSLWWAATEDMLADGLGKGTVSRTGILQFAKLGEWILKYSCQRHDEPFVAINANTIMPG